MNSSWISANDDTIMTRLPTSVFQKLDPLDSHRLNRVNASIPALAARICKLPATSCRLEIAGWRLQVGGYKLQVAGYKVRVAGYRLPVAGCDWRHADFLFEQPNNTKIEPSNNTRTRIWLDEPVITAFLRWLVFPHSRHSLSQLSGKSSAHLV
jgi:hypothetical protein